ncbi:Peptidase family M28 protein [Rhizoctonia solani]|uniref:Peptide hydrolase n=1 Tax=Rhizoctonia solani TaxID=456999 RepID=A0A8H8T264_9AGAM|nr:Peptidase family M28 protein [Rhizoctonia solani]QRW25512.1 Peptidase family M28 protein [Rhizoctonia solani]
MYAAASFLLATAIGALGVPATVSEFNDLSLRTIQFSNEHIEKLPIAAIESLRFAPALPRPLSSDSLNAARASIANISILTATTISDEAIEELQGRYERKLWGPGYVDITDSGPSSSIKSRAVVAPNYPTPNPSAHPELTPMLAMVTASEIKSYVSQLSTGYATRYYRSTNARAPSLWIQSQFASWLGTSQAKLAENSFNQPNVIGRIEAKSGSASAGIVILGAHLDSTSQSASSSAPGADDDASGVAVMMAIMRILKANNYQGTYAIEAHAYAGEEGGLLGAKTLAASYKSAGKTVRGMLDFEMIGYQPNTSSNSGKSSTITVLSDPVSAMSTHMTNVVKAYVPTAERRSVSCGYGCSDHYAFYDAGYPVVCIAAYGPNDGNLNPNYHRTTDTIDKLNFDKGVDFVKAGLAWVVEVAA